MVDPVQRARGVHGTFFNYGPCRCHSLLEPQPYSAPLRGRQAAAPQRDAAGGARRLRCRMPAAWRPPLCGGRRPASPGCARRGRSPSSGETDSSAAIWALVMPSAISRATSNSRTVSGRQVPAPATSTAGLGDLVRSGHERRAAHLLRTREGPSSTSAASTCRFMRTEDIAPGRAAPTASRRGRDPPSRGSRARTPRVRPRAIRRHANEALGVAERRSRHRIPAAEERTSVGEPPLRFIGRRAAM